jgi:hypothetical protein
MLLPLTSSATVRLLSVTDADIHFRPITVYGQSNGERGALGRLIRRKHQGSKRKLAHSSNIIPKRGPGGEWGVCTDPRASSLGLMRDLRVRDSGEGAWHRALERHTGTITILPKCA